ncbi:hypothetical protein [Sphingomonas sp. DT-204]|uniref:hypothetical protein n=1 Tax=Sphingomonas sp. DT-204 TaxID=3396166 RepID=UPI003F1C2008
MQNSQYYRVQAERARADADAATLDNVRDRALRSVAAFEAIATSLERIARRRAEREENGGEYAGRVPAGVTAMEIP